MPVRRGAADANEPVLDPDTQSQIQAWTSATVEDKTSLLEAVTQMNLVDLDGLREVATAEEAKKTTAAIMGLMMIHRERVVKVTKKWEEEDARMQKIQERMGAGGLPGRGTPGTQPGQMPMRPGRRGR
jgi:hypothetical protein